MKRIVVVVPTYNEKDNIVPLISLVLEQEKRLSGFDLHVLVSDSHSPDRTIEEVQKAFPKNPKVHTLDVRERGIGVGLVKGFNLARDRYLADILVSMDADFSHSPKDLPKLVEGLEEKYDLVLGSRFVAGGRLEIPLIRRIFSYGASLLSRVFSGYFSIKEWTTSYRAITTRFYSKIDLDRVPWRAKTFVFQTAFLYQTLSQGARVRETPITFTDRRAGRTKMQVIRYIFDVLKFLIKVRFRRNEIEVKFIVVGVIGFIINTLLLYLFYDSPLFFFLPPKFTPWGIFGLSHPDFRLFIASVLAVEGAIVSNFLWHENWTFRKRQKIGRVVTRFWQFNITALGSPVITVATVNILTPYFGIYYLVSNAIGVLLGMTWNYILNTRIIWRGKPALT